jgi:hypothetical protein
VGEVIHRVILNPLQNVSTIYFCYRVGWALTLYMNASIMSVS